MQHTSENDIGSHLYNSVREGDEIVLELSDGGSGMDGTVTVLEKEPVIDDICEVNCEFEDGTGVSLYAKPLNKDPTAMRYDVYAVLDDEEYTIVSVR